MIVVVPDTGQARRRRRRALLIFLSILSLGLVGMGAVLTLIDSSTSGAADATDPIAQQAGILAGEPRGGDTTPDSPSTAPPLLPDSPPGVPAVEVAAGGRSGIASRGEGSAADTDRGPVRPVGSAAGAGTSVDRGVGTRGRDGGRPAAGDSRGPVAGRTGDTGSSAGPSQPADPGDPDDAGDPDGPVVVEGGLVGPLPVGAPEVLDPRVRNVTDRDVVLTALLTEVAAPAGPADCRPAEHVAVTQLVVSPPDPLGPVGARTGAFRLDPGASAPTAADPGIVVRAGTGPTPLSGLGVAGGQLPTVALVDVAGGNPCAGVTLEVRHTATATEAGAPDPDPGPAPSVPATPSTGDARTTTPPATWTGSTETSVPSPEPTLEPTVEPTVPLVTPEPTVAPTLAPAPDGVEPTGP